ncbi:MAG TPA: amino acid adenylation domain-containing protein, partial [Candidatus Deferrimicrobium sp.]|nr:amino acid adenylation domain-containing protein [Candidatus Deferrimicrobium sp.]
AAYPRGKTIHQLFEEQVEKVPDHIAVINPTAVETLRATSLQITYRQLNKQSNRLAGLLKEKGVLPDTIVGMMIGRSVEMIIGIMGILKSGAAYLPIDPDYPQERIDYMLKDSGAEFLVTTNDKEGEKVGRWEGERVLLELIIHSSNHPSFHHSNHSSDLAYIIYTSGTTGKPKGVLIEHKNVVRLLFNDRFQFDFNERDVWSLFHSYSFDFSVWEIYGALLYGGRLVIIPRSTTLDPGEFLQVLKGQQVTVLSQTPSAFYNLIYEELKQGGKELNARYVIFGGEALQPGKLSQWQKKYPDTLLVNMFGITETTVHVTYQEIGVKEITEGISNIGKPIPTLSAYIMDMNRQLVIPGVSGELYVGGEGVARGYLNRPELTGERFVANPYKTGDRLYRSGDLVQLITGGQMEYQGRIDHQVQIRGFRVELGEIENLLLKHEHIKDAVVIDGSDEKEDHYLCAYIVPNTFQGETLLDVPLLQNYLSRQLPGYMIPPYFVQLAKIPLTANGKVDRKQLPPPRVNLEGLYTQPRNKEETLLVEIWQEVLELERVGIDDNFFNVGGDSIKAIRLSSAINSRLNSHIKILDLYTHGTIRQLATLLDRLETFDREYLHGKVTAEIEALKARVLEQKPELADMVEDVYPMSDIEKGLVFYYLKYVGSGIYHDQFVYPFYDKNFDVKRFERAINLLMEKHPILRTAFNLDEFEESVSIVYKKVTPDFTYCDLAQLSPGEQQHRLADFSAQDRQNYFSASVAPLWRIVIFEVGQGSLYFTLVCHHALLDGWSIASLVTEVHNIYRELENDLSYMPRQLKSTYKDTVIEELIMKQDLSSREYWRKELEEYPRLEFSETLKSKSEMEGMITYRYNAGMELLDQLNHCSDRLHISIKNLCFGAYACFMNMFCYEDDVVVGCVTNIRTEKEDGDKVLGCFLNTTPVRLNISRGITWKEYLQLVERKMLEVKKHERLSLFEIAAAIGEKSKD